MVVVSERVRKLEVVYLTISNEQKKAYGWDAQGSWLVLWLCWDLELLCGVDHYEEDGIDLPGLQISNIPGHMMSVGTTAEIKR